MTHPPGVLIARRHVGRSLAAAGAAVASLTIAYACIFESLPLRAQQRTTITTQPLMVRGYIAARLGTEMNTAAFLAEGIAAQRVGETDRAVIELAARNTPQHDIYLPGIDVFLGDERGRPINKPVPTDLSGRFTLYAEKPGTYQICWKADGFIAGCDRRTVALGNQPEFLSKMTIAVEPRPGYVIVFGNVRLADGSLPRMLQPMADINAFATVSLSDVNRKSIYKTWVNNFGEYLIPQVPIKTQLFLRAVIEKGEIEQPIQPESELHRAPAHEYDLRIANTPPRLEPLLAIDVATGKHVAVATPGALFALNAVAHDRDGDELEFIWELPSGSGVLSATHGQKVTWRLPGARGHYSIAVIASDGKGGYDRMSLLLRADGGGVPFSGIVRDKSDVPIPDAEIEINGERAKTDTAGLFHASVKPANRYVVNMRKRGFAFSSKIYDRGVTGGTWNLTRAHVTEVDPTRRIDIVHRRTQEDCPGLESTQLDWKSHPRAMIPQVQDGKGNVVFPDPRSAKRQFGKITLPWEHVGGECGPGISVSIPANALIDGAGRVPTGRVQLSLATVDLNSPDQMPGDDTVLLPNGSTTVMRSFGAGMIEATAGGQRLRLRPDTQATVRFPVDPSQLAAGGRIPDTIPVLFYNEAKGVWVPEGLAVLTGTGANRAYVAKATHFSAINVDVLFTNQACVRVLSSALPPIYRLETTVQEPGGLAPKVKSQQLNNASPSEHVLYNLPTNATMMLVPTPSLGVDRTPYGVFIVNTGQPQNPTIPNLPAGPPYTACATTVTLTPQAFPNAPVSGEFLHGLYSFAAVNITELNNNDPLSTYLNVASSSYNNVVDGPGFRTTLDKFRQVNGFINTNGTPLPGVINTKYANSGDLGFGRDMYCKKQLANDGQFDYACYVSNYGDVSTPDLQDAIDAANAAVNNVAPVATVAMEYSRLQDGTGSPLPGGRTVKFFVYDSQGNPQNAADLDGTGLRPVPQLCMVCHGGTVQRSYMVGNVPVPLFSTYDDTRLGSRFVPFDLRYYTFPPAPNDKANPAVQAAFKQLNQDIVAGVAQAVGASAIVDVITEMYAGNVNDQRENFTVPGWLAPTEPAKPVFYRGVVSNACRMCHTAQPFASLQFDTAAGYIAQLSAVGGRVCAEQVMPHAKRTHDIFWAINDPTVTVPGVVPHMASQLQVFGSQFGPPGDWIGLNGPPPTFQCGTSFTAGGQTPLSFYQQTIQPLFATPQNRCTNCHGAAGNLNLSAGVSYGNLVNHLAFELGTMNRVTPFSTSQSYMSHKIEGDQVLVGGFGEQMPADCDPPGGHDPLCMSGADRLIIQNWIDVRGADGP